jgi:hypothetical protein
MFFKLIQVVHLKNIDLVHLGNIWFTGLSSTDIWIIFFGCKTHSDYVLIWILSWAPIITHVSSSVAVNHLLPRKFNVVTSSDVMSHLQFIDSLEDKWISTLSDFNDRSFNSSFSPVNSFGCDIFVNELWLF